MDSITIRDLCARCVIGVDPDERREAQDVILNIRLGVDTRAAGLSDRFEDAVDYRAVKKAVLAAVEASSFHLVEALAEHVAAVCLDRSGVQTAVVTVDKPGALRFARSVAVEISRERQG